MAYTLPETIPYEGMIDYITGTAAGLKAVPELAPLAAPWDERKLALRAARDARDDARARVLECSGVVEVRDTIWDKAVIDLSGRAYLAAGKDASKIPYAPLFGTVPAATATKLGPAKATAYGVGLVAKATTLAHPDLGASIQAVAAANTQLSDAGTARAAATVDARTYEIKRLQAHAALELLIAETELGILQKFVGRDDLVRAILAPPRKATSKRGAAAEDTVEEGGGDPAPATGTG